MLNRYYILREPCFPYSGKEFAVWSKYGKCYLSTNSISKARQKVEDLYAHDTASTEFKG